MFKKSSSLYSSVASRFLVSYAVVLLTTLMFLFYVTFSKTDEMKYDLRSFNLEIQNSINYSFSEIANRVEFYAKLIEAQQDSEALKIISDEDISMFFKALYVVNPSLKVVYKRQFEGANEIDFDLPWLDELRQSRYIISEFIFKNKQLSTFFVAYDIGNGFKLVAEVDKNYIATNIKSFLSEKNRVAYVVDYNGNYLFGDRDNSGYNVETYSDTNVIDEMFIRNKDVDFDILNTKATLSEYMEKYNVFVVTEATKSGAVLARFLVLLFGFLAIVFYTLWSKANLKFALDKFINPIEATISFLKDKSKRPNGEQYLSELNTINSQISILYSEIDSAKFTLDEYKTRFGYIFEKSPLVILVYDAYSGAIVDASHSALEFYGYTYKEILNTNMSEISAVGFNEMVFDRRKGIEDKSKNFSIITKHNLKNGNEVEVSVKSDILTLKDSKYIFMIVDDVSYDMRKQESSESIQQLVSKFKNIIMVAGKEAPFIIKYATQNIENTFNISYDKLLVEGFDLKEIIAQSDKLNFTNEIELHKKVFTNVTNTTDSINFIVKLITKTKQVVPFKAEIKYLRDENGDFSGIVYMFSDYQEHYTMQERYESELKFHKNIIWATSAASLEYNAKTDSIKANATFAGILGYTNLSDLNIDKDMMRAILVDEFTDFAGFFSKIEADKGVYSGDVRFYTLDKNIIWLHIHARVIEVDDNSKPTIISGIAENVTDKKVAFLYQDLAARLFSYSKEGIIVFDTQWNIIDANNELSRSSGYSRDELLNSNISLLKSKLNDNEEFAKALEAADKFGRWHGKLWFRHKNGEDYLESANLTSLNDSNGVTICYVAVMSDVSESNSTQDYLEHIAYHDPLTKLPNRFLFSQKLEEVIRAKKDGKEVAIAYLDMDGFKGINDTYGHKAGDKFLVEISSHIDTLFDERDMFARIGGDEFVAIILYEKAGEVYEIVENMLSIASGEVFYDDNVRLSISASIGVSMRSVDNLVSPENLLEQADWAMYQAKLAGKNRYYIFDNTKDRNFKSQYEDNNKILTALENNEFFLEYQPEINIKTNEVIGYEALLRWKKDGKTIYPNDFFPLIKRQNVIDDLAFFSIKQALNDQKEWSKNGIYTKVGVNLSIEQLCKDSFFERFKNLILQDDTLDSKSLQIEIIDANSTPDLEYASKFLQKYKRFGVQFILDDFASRSSSFDALELLPIDKIKIDKNICSYMFFNQKAFITVRMLKNLSDIFSKSATIKNLKDISTLRVLIGLGFYTFQGNFFEKPMSAERVAGYEFKGIEGLDLDLVIDNERFDILKDCIMLKEFAQNIITHIINKDFNSDEESFDGLRREMLAHLQTQPNHHKEIAENLIESLTSDDKTKALQLARLANIMCMKILDFSNKEKEAE